MFDAVQGSCRQAQPRPSKLLSYQLTNHAKAFLEAGQYTSGYDFLYRLHTAGTSISTPPKPHAGFLPPPAQLSLAASLIVFPPATTHLKHETAPEGSDAALRYLRSLLHSLEGPAYHTIRKAFAFPQEVSRRRPPGHRSLETSPPSGHVDRLAGPAANAKSLWSRAYDFWHAVGWAFNCSIAHEHRWQRWKLWLDTILGFLERDWEICEKESRDSPDRTSRLQDTLIWCYMQDNSNDPANRSVRGRMIRAIFAMATGKSKTEFPEVWAGESKIPEPSKAPEKPTGEVNFETGELADYGGLDDVAMTDADWVSAAPPEYPSSSGSEQNLSDSPIRTPHDAFERLGGRDAIQIRQRLVALLARVAEALPGQFTDVGDFFDSLAEVLKELPTITFGVLISTWRLSRLGQMALNVALLIPLTSSKIPGYIVSLPAQEDLEKILLPLLGRQSNAANAKVSLLLEQIFMYMMRENALVPQESLREAVETGVNQRLGRLASGKKGKSEEENQAENVLRRSSNRLLGLLEVLEVTRKSDDPSLLSSFSSTLSSAPDSEMDRDD